MKLSVVIPAYNEEKVLPRLLASLLKQKFRDFDITVADAFSKDRTREVAQQYGAKVVDGGMPGPGRNRGALKATGDLLLFLDADVELPNEDFIGDCVSEFEERDLDMATCELTTTSEKRSGKFSIWCWNTYAEVTKPFLAHLPGHCVFVRRSTHELVKGFDEAVVFAEDHDYARRAVKLGAKFDFLTSQKIPIDGRRFDREGYLVNAMKFTVAEIYMIAFGGIKKNIFTYKFGYGEKEKDKTTKV